MKRKKKKERKTKTKNWPDHLYSFLPSSSSSKEKVVTALGYRCIKLQDSVPYKTRKVFWKGEELQKNLTTLKSRKFVIRKGCRDPFKYGPLRSFLKGVDSKQRPTEETAIKCPKCGGHFLVKKDSERCPKCDKLKRKKRKIESPPSLGNWEGGHKGESQSDRQKWSTRKGQSKRNSTGNQRQWGWGWGCMDAMGRKFQRYSFFPFHFQFLPIFFRSIFERKKNNKTKDTHSWIPAHWIQFSRLWATLEQKNLHFCSNWKNPKIWKKKICCSPWISAVRGNGVKPNGSWSREGRIWK